MLKAILFILPFLVLLAIVAGGGFLTYKFRYRAAKSNQALIITGPKLGDPSKEQIYSPMKKVVLLKLFVVEDIC